MSEAACLWNVGHTHPLTSLDTSKEHKRERNKRESLCGTLQSVNLDTFRIEGDI